MRNMASWFGLLALSGLALLTASINVRSTQRTYNLGRILSAKEELTRIIRFRRERCWSLTNMRTLAEVRQDMGLTDETLYGVPTGLPKPQPLAMRERR